MERVNINECLGPIATKVIHNVDKIRGSKILDFSAIKKAKEYQTQLQKEKASKDFSELDPLHALYADAQHCISDFIEQFSNLPESRLLNEKHNEAEDIYMPAGPPMSPLTHSYFFCWAAFDMCVGIKKETYATIMLALYKKLKSDLNLIQVIQCMQESRMGLYRHESYDGKFVYFNELYTNKKIKAHIGSRYRGVPGEIWLVRLFPDPFGYGDYSVAFTTPYVIIKSEPGTTSFNTNMFYAEEEWLSFINRSLSKMKVKDPAIAYHNFMKYGLNKHYWPEYITDGYVNHTGSLIWLTGLPDKPETLPHSMAKK